MTPYHSLYWASLLTLKGASGTIESLSRSISNSRVDLNPHQVDAALFALRSPLSKGTILADEVGLGKTIEAGIVLSQRWAERKRRILLIVPATLRKQWQQELEEKFYLPTLILDARSYNQLVRGGSANPFDRTDRVVICSYNFASAKSHDVRLVPWDLAVIDEAHRLRNVFRTSSRMARTICEAVRHAPKLLLTATPLQNSLMELYGLVSVIDDHVFGDAESFRNQFVKAADEDRRNSDLRDRLRPICIRTLRKQVVEYIPYTKRVPITQDFLPNDDEHRLYEEVSAFLQREILISLPAGQRNLITMVLRKLLASSTFALGNTIRGLIGRLENLSTEIGLLDDDDLDGIEELQDELQEAEGGDDEDAAGGDNGATIDPKLLREELVELRRFGDLADGIRVNAKGEALLPALREAFARTDELGARRKAVVFTESRRTQRYLFDLLSANGYDGQLVMMNGMNNDPHSKAVYDRWLARHAGQDVATGSRPVDMKAAITEEFRDHATILIATEAAAEGVNLQFCSLVVNFDLPWNPQRIEQRIGRCHRYGQKHDVVVVNFINRRNQADQRVFELLSEKFQLFDGVFGSSDEVLGALESGVDIERRIAAVYRTCRSPEEIARAFDELQGELDEQIKVRMASTRQNLLENFDQEVNDRLRIHKDKTLESLSDRERWLLALTRIELNGDAHFDSDRPRFRYNGPDAPQGVYNFDWREAEANGEIFYRQDHALAARLIERAAGRPLKPAVVTFDYDAHGSMISVLQPYIGRSGWLELAKLTVETLDTEEFLLVAAVTDEGDWLDDEIARKLFLLPAAIRHDDALDAPDLEAGLDREIKARIRQVEERNVKFFDEEVLKLDHWSDDLKAGLEREIKDVDRQIREARKAATLAGTLAEKLEMQRAIKTLESTRSGKRRDLYEAQDQIDRHRDELIGRIETQLKQKHTVSPLFTIRWRIV
jgi:superfamily II DNA or RNA helicase